MADRILIATLYQGTTGTNTPHYLLNVSPRDLVTHNSEDNVFLVVKKDSSVPGSGDTISCVFGWGSGSNPFSGTPSCPTSFDSPHFLGTLKEFNNQTTVEYTLTITYGGNDFIEDPQIIINPS